MSYLISKASKIHKLTLLITDLLCFIIAGFIAQIVRTGMSDFYRLPLFWGALLVVLSSYYIFGAYEFSHKLNLREVFFRTLRALTLSALLISFMSFLFAQEKFGFFGRGVLLGTLFLFFILSTGPRFLINKLEIKAHHKMKWLFLTHSEVDDILRKDLQNNQFIGFYKFIDCRSHEIKNILERNWDVIVLPPNFYAADTELSSLLMDKRLSGQIIINICDFYEVHWNKIPVRFLDSQWFILSNGFSLANSPTQLRLKRWVDFTISLSLLFVLWPIMLLTALAIYLESEGHPIYKQARVGKNGNEFTIFKFRSMNLNAEKNGVQWAQNNDVRVTKVGKFIRSTRLDELPQLLNVLKGEMSFVGPRPERAEFNVEIEKVVPFYNVRHLVRPGITGWAQILYPYGASIEDSKEKFQYDLFYLKNYSIYLDLMIIIKTVSVVLLGKGR